jgi:hypothetical protein
MNMRIRLSLLPVLALLLAAFAAGCGDDGGGGGGDTGKADTSASPRTVLKKASTTHVKSGVLELNADATVKGGSGAGPFSFSLEGPFKSRGVKQTPLLDWTIKLRGAGQNQTLGLIATSDNAFVKFQGQTYEGGKKRFRRFVGQARRNARGSDKQSLRSLGANPASWVKDPRLSAGPSVGGDATRKVTGSVNVRRMLADLAKVLRSPELRREIERQGQSPDRLPKVSGRELDQVAGAVKSNSFEVDVDDQDIARRVRFSAAFTAPAGSSAKGQSGTVRFSYELPEVGTNPDISAPSGAKPLQLLLQQLGMGATLPGGGALKTQ